MNQTTRRLLVAILLLRTDILTLAEDVTIVGSVHSNTTLICNRSFYNYPEWRGPNGTIITYMYGDTINPNHPAYRRLMWASNKRDLIIRDTQKSDAGLYQCSEPDPAVYLIALEVRVSPDRPEIQNKVGSIVRGKEDQAVTLTCISRGGYPASYLDWYRDTAHLTSRRTEAVQADGTTTVTITSSFTATRNLDKTNYTCQSSFDPPDSPLITPVMLYLSLKPSMPVITGTTTISENNNVQLQCRSTGCRPEGNMSWSFDGSITSPNVQNTPVSDKFTITSSFTSRTLYRADNVKSVTCRVQHESLTTPRTTSLNLNVQFGPSTVTLTGNREIVADGTNTLTLTCTVSTANPVSDISWKQNGQLVVSVDRDDQKNGQYGGKQRIQEITVTPTREMDGNAISCTAEHNLLQPTQQINLDLKYHPIVIIQEGSTTTYNEGDRNKVLQCTASSKPTSVFTWFHRNIQVKTSTSPVSANQFDYTIGTVSRTHYGVYKCEADNSIGTTGLDSITVRVQFAPTAISLTGNQQIIANGQNKLTLTCTTDSAYPTATVTWWTGSTQLTEGTSQTTSAGNYGGRNTIGKLETRPTRTMDGASISCQGSNSQGPSIPPVDQVALNLKYHPIVTIQEGSSTTYNEGDKNKILHCTASSKPASVFTWFHGNTQINTSASSVLLNQFDYTIGTVSRTHYGAYKCEADNSVGTVGQDFITVRVKFAPTSVALTGNQQIIANGQNKLTLTCTTDAAYPTATVTWWNGSTQLTEGTSQTTSAGNYGGRNTVAKLEIRPTRTMDGDSISCHGTNSQGPSNPPIDQVALNLKYNPITTIVGGSQKYATEGDTDLPLDCTSESKPPAKFTWQKTGDSSPIKTGTGTADNNRLVYTIPTVSRYHAGTYRCTSDNEIPSPDSAEQELIVFYPPDITVSTTNTTINDTDHYITCSAFGFPSSYHFTTWTQKWPNTGEIIRDNLKSSSVTSSSTQSLHFTSLTYQDTGVYACGAGNGVKNVVSVGSVFLLVKSSPVVTLFSNETLMEDLDQKVPASLNKRFSIQLTVYSNAGDVVTKIYKLSDNTLINVNGTSVNNVKTTTKLSMYSRTVNTDDAYELKIYHTIKSQKEFGEFVLYLTNDIGTTTQKFEIIPEGPPEIPIDFASLQGSATFSSIGFTWMPGFHGGADQTFHIEYRSEGHEWKEGTRLFGGKVLNQQLEKVVDGLDPGSPYLFRIYASNKYGQSEKSEEILANTIEGQTISDVNGLKDNSNTGAVAGGVTAGVLGLVVICLLLLLLRKNNRLPVCMNKNESRTTAQTPSSGGDSTEVNADNFDNIRSSGNVYDDLNTGTESAHLYAVLQGDRGQPNQRHVDKQNIERKMFGISDTKQCRENHGDVRDAACSSSKQAVIYSNLKLAAE